METANWRRYRRHLIIARTAFFGRRRFDVWRRGEFLGSFRSTIHAELHVDSLDPSVGEPNW